LDVARCTLKNLKIQALARLAPGTSTAEAEALFRLLNRLNDDVEIRPVPGVELGMEQFAIGANFERAAARGNQRERFDALAELENFGRQTDGLRRVVSNYAVFDRDLGFHRQAPFRQRNYRRGFKWSRVVAPIPLMQVGDSTLCSLVMSSASERAQPEWDITEM